MPILRDLLNGWISQAITPPPIAQFLQFTLVEARDGASIVKMAVDARHHNPMGIVHGGIFCDLADAAMGTALASVMDEGRTFATTNLSMNYFTPVTKAELIATGRVVRKGRVTAYVECDIQDEQGKVIAKASCNCLIS